MTGRPEHWHLITGEYPPQRGGVADYTRAVARGLAACGADVHVWCPPAGDVAPVDPGVAVHAVAGSWSRADLRRIDALLDADRAPRRLLVQWVPHAFGQRSLNLAFCQWIRSRGRRGDRVDLLVHEAVHAFGEGSWRQDAAAAVHRVMVTLLLSVTARAWVTIPAWADRLRRYTWGRQVEFCWLPVTSNIPLDADPEAVATLRGAFGGRSLVVGHFGTYNTDTRGALHRVLPQVCRADPHVGLLFAGRDSDAFREEFLARNHVEPARVVATGTAEAKQLSHAIQACDVLVQPFVDGASTRRTTLMAGLRHRVPIVTTIGRLSDSTWTTSGAVVGVRAGDDDAMVRAVIDLLRDPERRRQLSARGRDLYDERFDIRHIVTALQSERCLSV
jgi:glycosyltransferase involved in cell wall biosynthesis